MALQLHLHGDLAALLADLARLPPPRDPFAPHRVVTAIAGPAAALRAALALHHGVAAHLETPSLGAFLDGLLRALDPTLATAATEDPWQARNLTWPIVDALLEAPPDGLAPQAGAGVNAPTLAFARRLAESLQRALIRAPERLRDPELARTRPLTLPAWQVGLWRRVRDVLAARHPDVPPPADRLERLTSLLQTAPQATLDALFPGPLAVFGHPGVGDPPVATALSALAARVDVHLFTLATDPALDPHQRRLREAVTATPDATRRASPPAADPRSALGRLQRAFLGDGPRVTETHPAADGDDASVRVTLAPGLVAQVERLRDALLSLLDADPTLEPRDIHIATLDLVRVAPLLEAILAETLPPAAPDACAPPPLLTRGADLPESRSNPLADALLAALRLPDGGLALPDVGDFLAHPAVLRALDLTPAQLRRCEEWFTEAGIHTGRDADHRGSLGLPARDAHTFRHGFDRLMLGYALPARDDLTLPPPFERVAPVATVEGTEVAQLGRCIDLLSYTFKVLDDTVSCTACVWRERFRALAERLAGRHAESTNWLQGVLARGFDWGCDDERLMTFDAARLLLSQSLETRHPPQAFPAGGVTVGPLRPLRARPARVVCLLALDVEGLGAAAPITSFDLLAPQATARLHPVEEDLRAAVLEHVLSASERCLVFATAQDGARDAPELTLPEPAQLILRTLDDVAPGWRARGFATTSTPPDDWWDPRLRTPRAPRPPAETATTEAPSPARTSTPSSLSLGRLVELLADPFKTVARDILGLALYEPRDRLPGRDLLEPNGLDNWQVGERLLSLHLAGVPQRTARRLVIVEGLLPPGHAGQSTFARVAADADRIATGLLGAIEVLTEDEGPSGGSPARLPLDMTRVPIALELAGVRLDGEVPNVLAPTLAPEAAPAPPLRVTWRFGRARPQDTVRLWIHHLALTLALTRAPMSLLAVRATDARDRAELIMLPPLPRATAHRLLEALMRLAVAMHVEVPHLYLSTAEAFARAVEHASATSSPPDLRTARTAWSSVPRSGRGVDSDPSRDYGEAHGALGQILTREARSGDYPLDHPGFREAALEVFGPLNRHLRRLPLPLGRNPRGPR
jgi:exodeoxyribonuclease V gamma subunit